MTVRRDVLRFLRDVPGFVRDVDPAATARHANALNDIIAPTILEASDHPLRPAQERAWIGLSEVRAGLLLGPPGTGKTHLLSWLVLGHVWANQTDGLPSRVFVTAFTRSAIETLLMAVAPRADYGPHQPAIVYLTRGRAPELPDRVDCIDLAATGGVAGLRERLTQPGVILAGTVWGLNAALAAGCFPTGAGQTAPFFDLVAIDEASQMVLGQGLMALAAMASKCRVVVAGDDRQLPPIRSARGMAIDGREVGGSLYAFLKASNAPEYALDETFRLNQPLTVYPERRFYSGGYRSAVADRKISLADGWAEGLRDWERVALDPSYPTVILVHDGPSAATESPFEVNVGGRLAELYAEHLRDASGFPMTRQRFWRDGFALVSPHRAQNAALRRRIGNLGPDVFVETVDRIQGRERDVIVMTYTVSDPEFALAEAEFIFSPERLNVAITRARSKLVVVIARRLLDLVPPQQENLDKAEGLREFVFASRELGETRIERELLESVHVTVRVNGFQGEEAEVARWEEPRPVVDEEPPDPRALALLEVIRELGAMNPFGSVALPALQRAVPHEGGIEGLYGEVRGLHGAGLASLWEQHGPHGTFWTARALDSRRRVFGPADLDIRERVFAAVGSRRPRYSTVRDNFLWMGTRYPGTDLLRQVVDAMVTDELLEWTLTPGGHESLTRTVGARTEADAVVPPAPPPADDDFIILNALEDIEAARIESGLVETWSDLTDVASRLGRPLADVAGAVSRLSADGHVMLAAEGRVRTRMAELAREVRYVKQRFAQGDSGERPFLVRALKVRLRNRVKPVLNVHLRSVLETACVRDSSSAVDLALHGLQEALCSTWGPEPSLAAFQARSFTELLSAWLGTSADDAFVVVADTGSGKTEAAVLPMIAGACVDALRGVGGTRAVLAYPRIRLVANQAQRLVRYLAALAAVTDMPTLTIGVQFGDIPSSYNMGDAEREKTERAGWVKKGEAWEFPLFGCPALSCGGPLELRPGAGSGSVDQLRCYRCGWAFGGWVGTKQGLRTQPPTFFLPTMDSLHQWMQDPRAGKIFGDSGSTVPRAFLADEIHLYAFIHGAHVGYAMRRLLERLRFNDSAHRPCIAVGMSATLGDPARAFGRLIGRDIVRLVGPEEGETPINPRGREYFYFIQPEIESRDRDIAGASTAIQTLMCLAHGMRRRRGVGGFRSLAFLDSIDKVRRLHAAYDDAEVEQGLASLRTARYDDDPVTGRPRSSCCGEPATCERFVDGECWYFAATDNRQASAERSVLLPGQSLSVARSPVYSGTEGTIEAMVQSSDVVFATSSLEVGYDDPDIGLVFQHYGPQSLASFIQRKGRGGRGADDRPITAVTLSLYAPRDTDWFHNPDAMLDARGFEAPLNPSNHFVRRAQIVSQLLDGLARYEAVTGTQPWLHGGGLRSDAIAMTIPSIESVFGPRPWQVFGFSSLASFWERACGDADPCSPIRSAHDARAFIPWLPTFLHDAAGLPLLQVILPDGTGTADHDMALAFALLAPGNISRRFHARMGAWRPPRMGQAPWFADVDYVAAERFQPCGPLVQDLLDELPTAARLALGPGTSAEVVRPLSVTLEEAGTFAPRGAGWSSNLFVGPAGLSFANTPAERAAAIRHNSGGQLDGCTIVRADLSLCSVESDPVLAPQIECIRVFVGTSSVNRGSGLRITNLAWGSEAVIPSQMPGSDPATFTQIFTDPFTNQPTLHGYDVEAEGVQVAFDRDRISAFIEGEIASPPTGVSLWQKLHMARAEVTTRLRAAGVGLYDAERLGTLTGYLATTDAYSVSLGRMRRFWRTEAFTNLLEQVRSERLGCDPLLTPRRLARAGECLQNPAAAAAIRDSLAALEDPAARRRYIRSTLVNSLSLRWRQLFVMVAQGDDRRVTVHAKLPFHFPAGAPDVVTIAETGRSGDGTTRAFAQKLKKAWRAWSTGFAVHCPSAAEDAALERFFERSDRHAVWLALNPRDDAGIASMAAEISDDRQPLPASVARALFGHMSIGAEQFRIYDLVAAIREARGSLEASLGRTSADWELASAVTTKVEVGGGSPELTRLFAAYAGDPAIDGEGSLSSRSRFAEQVHRLGSRLCTDGCRACVRQDGGPLVGLVASSMVSRGLVSRYLCV